VFDPLKYWESRYVAGDGSGKGSRGRQANHKAAFVNSLIEKYQVQTVVDWGCGDGIVAARIKAPRYIGLEVSAKGLELCKALADGPSREWHLYDGMNAPSVSGDLSLSLDVIFHLITDELYRRHLELVFGSAPIVCITSSNRDERGNEHVLHREFLHDVPRGWSVVREPAKDADVGLWVFRHHRRKARRK
jgi:hypothetical protein